MKTFRQYLNEQLRDPEFAREYESVTEELGLGVQLAMRREQVGLTQQQLAERTAIKQPMIARIEQGQTPTLHTLQRLASGLEACVVVSSVGIDVKPDKELIKRNPKQAIAKNSSLTRRQVRPSLANARRQPR